MGIEWDVDTVTDADVRIDHRQAVEEIRTEKRHRGEMVRAALYTYRLCYVTQTVGPRPDQVSSQDFAAELGYAKSYVTLLRRLGRALVIHAVPADSRLFSALIRAATRKEVARILDRDEAVPHHEIWRVIDEHAAHVKSSGGEAGQGAEEVVLSAAKSVREALTTADAGMLERLETVLGDLFFEVRQARRI
jgi:hypothetical protein